MDWNLVISGVIGLIAGGGVSWLFKLREDKASAKADALTKMNDVIAYQVTSFGDTLKKQDIIISDQRELIREYKSQLDEYKSKIREYDYKAAERDRKIEGMQKVLTKEVGKKKFAESRICLVEGCDLRKPDIDTFNSDEK